jgi:predicted sugar kinase
VTNELVVWLAECEGCMHGRLVRRFVDVAERNAWAAEHRAKFGHTVYETVHIHERESYPDGPVAG